MSTANPTTDAADKCPVDHTARQKWLDAAKDSQPSPPQVDTFPIPRTRAEALKLLHERGLTKYSLDTGKWEADFTKSKLFNPRNNSTTSPSQTLKTKSAALPTDREVSTIPRAIHTNHDREALNSAERAALPTANSEQDTGHDKESGNWIYPSQSMFFSAMKRKGHSPRAADMATIVPIHNAVNERAWAEIKTWEAAADPTSQPTCGGPKLVSFAGDSSKLTPRARWRGWVGYAAPFDRHDWVVERCRGERVEYVIDFYGGAGLEGGGGGEKGGNLSFHLDVRPKLNSWEGWRMRVARAVGWE